MSNGVPPVKPGATTSEFVALIVGTITSIVTVMAAVNPEVQKAALYSFAFIAGMYIFSRGYVKANQ